MGRVAAGATAGGLGRAPGWSALGILVGGGAACLSPEGGTVSLPAGDRALLAIVDAPLGAERPTAFAIDGTRAFVTPPPFGAWLLAYEYSSQKLGWPPGPIHVYPPKVAGCGADRPLPTPAQIWRVEEGAEPDPQDHLPPEVSELCLAELSIPECWRRGGCLRELPLGPPLFCDLTCEDLTAVAPPAPPTPPTAPAAPQVDCVPGELCRLTVDACPVDPRVVLGSTYCRQQQEACGPERFRRPRDGSAVVFVDPAATGPGDGSEDSPYVGLAQAIGAAPSGTTFLLAAGDHALPGGVPSPLRLVGACPRSVRIHGGPRNYATLELEHLTIDGPVRLNDGHLRDVLVLAPVPAEANVIEVRGSARLEEVGVIGAGPGAVEVGAQAQAHIEALWSQGPGTILASFGGAVRADGLRQIGRGDRGIIASAGAELDLRRVVLESTANEALAILTSSVTVEDGWLDTEGGDTVVVAPGAHLTLRRVAARTPDGTAIRVIGSGLEGEDLRLSATEMGVDVIDSTATLTRVRVEGAVVGVHTSSTPPGVSTVVTDLAVEGSGCAFSRGVWLDPGTTLRLERAEMRDLHFGAFLADRASLTVRDLLVERRGQRCEGDSGVHLDDAGTLSLERARFIGLSDHGVFAQGPDSALVITDLEMDGYPEGSMIAPLIALNLSGAGHTVSVARASTHGTFAHLLRLGRGVEVQIRDSRLQQDGGGVLGDIDEATLRIQDSLLVGHGGPGLLIGRDEGFQGLESQLSDLSPGLSLGRLPDRGQLKGLRFRLGLRQCPLSVGSDVEACQ